MKNTGTTERPPNRQDFWRPAGWYTACSLIVLADQLTKFGSLNSLQDAPVNLLPFLTLRLACNTGAAFSMLQGYGPLLILVGVAFGIYFAWQIWKLQAGERVLGCVYSLILAGAVGNVIDRTIRGCVVDFVHVHYAWFNFPVFNLADSAITVGATIWFLWLVRDVYQSKRKTESEPVEDS